MSPPAHRLMMTTDTVGGVWVYATTLARELTRRGFGVTLVTQGPPPRSDQLAPLRDVPGLDLEITDLKLEWMDPAGDDMPRALDRLRDIERRIRPDLVHLNSYREARGDWSVPVIVAAHSCVRSWWRACRGDDPTEPQWQRYAANVAAGLLAANMWIAPSATQRSAVKALYAPPTPGRVIWNGLERFPRPAPKEPFVVAAGRMWDEAKNLSLLAAIAPDLEWPVRVAGKVAPDAPRDVPNLEALGELPRADLLELLRSAAIFIAPALYEPFGLTVLEAAAGGCALVLGDIPSFRELWDGAALFVDPRDGTAVRSALTQLIQNAAMRKDLQRRAALRARRYSLSKMIEAYQGAYITLMKTSAPPVEAQAASFPPLEAHA
ncbi:MAG: glycosyltransferase family 4 protein [Gemmatimonas sp.]